MAAQPNPFTIPTPVPPPNDVNADSMNADGLRHGSAEQTGPSRRRRTYLDSMGGETPTQTPRSTSPRRTPPRSPRARSMGPHVGEGDEEEDYYEARRDAHREARRDTSIPVGTPFRLNACEQSLRSHSDELAAQRLMLQQLADAVQRLNADKEATDARLNQVFGLVDQRFAEAQANTMEVFNSAKSKFDTMAGTVSSIASEVMSRMDKINEQINQIKITPPIASCLRA